MIEEDKEDVLTSEATRENLIELWEMMLEFCISYMRDTPSGKHRLKTLELVRSFLKDNNCTTDLNHAQDVQESLAKLAAMDLPFSLK
jgi:hypothetical protein